MTSKTKSAADHLAHNPTMNRLLSLVHNQQACTRLVKEVLPPPLNQLVSHALIREGTIILICSSNMVASQVRFHEPALIAKFREKGIGHARKIQCVTSPASGPASPASTTNKRYLTRVAQQNLKYIRNTLYTNK